MAAGSDTTHVAALTTVGNDEEARRLIRGLVADRVVACGTVVSGVQSIFWWNGSITEDAEVLILLKTRWDRWTELQAAIDERHPYDVPELLALPVIAGSAPFLDWVTMETGGARKPS